MYRDLVTIVVPAYNAESFLQENIESILGQTYPNIEVIYVCDGCTDQTVDILEEYKRDNRLKIVIQDENQGAAVARNIGMDMAHGDWILFFDADDLFEPEMIETMLQKAEVTGADIVACYWDSFDKKPDRNSIVHNEMRKMLCTTYPIIDTRKEKRHIIQLVDKSIWTRIVHKSIYKKPEVCFQNIPNANDVYYSMVTVMNAQKIAYVDRVFLHYRSDKGRATLSTFRNKRKNYLWEACDKIYEYIMSEEKNRRFLQSFYNDVFANIFTYMQYPVGVYLIDELKDKYFLKWGMAGGEVEDKLSYINTIIYRKILNGDRDLEREQLCRLAKVELVKRMSEVGCSIWGTGEQGDLLMNDIAQTDIRIQHVFDSSPNKWGIIFHGYVIEKFEEIEADNIIVTTSKYFEEIRIQIEGKAKKVFNLDEQIWMIPELNV